MEAIVAGVASQSLNAELTAKSSAAAMSQLRVESEARHKEHCHTMTSAVEGSNKLKSEIREVKSKAVDDMTSLLTTILERMDRQERNFEARMDRQEHQSSQNQYGAPRNRFRGRGQSYHTNDAHQSGERSDQQRNDRTPTGAR